MATRKSTTKVAEEMPKKTIRRRRPKITHEMIQERAYFLATSGQDGSELDHWLAAERELLVTA